MVMASDLATGPAVDQEKAKESAEEPEVAADLALVAVKAMDRV